MADLMWRGRAVRAVLFDLDGTLLDTAADIAAALNLALGDAGIAPIDESAVRGMIGRGSPILIERALRARGTAPDALLESRLVTQFFHHYEARQASGAESATPYEGAADALESLHRRGAKIAVVTNKHRRFAIALLERFGWMRWIELVVGGDSCERRKPDPQPLLYACTTLGCPVEDSIMVGDSSNDVDAARAAGMPAFCLREGYNEGRDPALLGADVLLGGLGELLPLLT